MQRIATVLVTVAATSPAFAQEPEPKVELAVLHAFPGIDLVETLNQARHEHGGPPANVGHASMNFELRDARAHTVVVKKLEMIVDSCDKPAAKRAKADTKPLAVQGYELYTWDDADPIASGTASIKLSGGPRRLQVKVNLDGITTYRGCAFAIDLVVDRVRKKIELPLQIIRFEPLRRK